MKTRLLKTPTHRVGRPNILGLKNALKKDEPKMAHQELHSEEYDGVGVGSNCCHKGFSEWRRAFRPRSVEGSSSSALGLNLVVTTEILQWGLIS